MGFPVSQAPRPRDDSTANGQRNMRHLLLMLPFAVLAIASGCRDKSPSALQFPEPSIDLGVVDGTMNVVHEFPFEVTGGGGIRIEGFQSSCSCIAALSSSVGQDLTSGNKGSIRVAIDPQGRSGRIRATVHVETSPSLAGPIVLNLAATVPSKPEVVGLSPVPVSAVVGIPVQVEFDLALDRLFARDPLRVDLDRSKLNGFTIDHEQLIETPVGPVGAQSEEMMHEIHRLRLGHPPFAEPGKELKTLQIAWMDSDLMTSVQFSAVVHHPLEVSPASTFLGYCKATEKINVSLPLATKPDTTGKNVSVTPVTESDDVGAAYNEASNCIDIRFAAPASQGRFVKSWNVRYSDSPAMAFTFSVSGIVE